MDEVTINFNPQPTDKMTFWLEEHSGDVVLKCLRTHADGHEDIIQNLVRFFPDGNARLAGNYYYQFTVDSDDKVVRHRFGEGS